MNITEPLPPARHEPTDGSPAIVVLAGCVLAAGIALSLIACGLLYGTHYRGRPTTRAAGIESSFRHGPDERTGIARDWIAQDAIVRAHLGTYGWVDRRTGVVRIPIKRAMAVLAAEAERPQPAGAEAHR